MRVNPLLRSPNWQVKLRLKFIQRDSKSTLSERAHSGPLRVQRPSYAESDRICHVYIPHPPGGIVSRDALKLDIAVEERAWGLITAPDAIKIYRNNRKQARQRTPYSGEKPRNCGIRCFPCYFLVHKIRQAASKMTLTPLGYFAHYQTNSDISH